MDGWGVAKTYSEPAANKTDMVSFCLNGNRINHTHGIGRIKMRKSVRMLMAQLVTARASALIQYPGPPFHRFSRGLHSRRAGKKAATLNPATREITPYADRLSRWQLPKIRRYNNRMETLIQPR